MDSNLDKGCLLRKIFPKEPPHRTIRQTGLYRHHNLRFQLIAIWWVRVPVFHFCNSLCTQYILPDQNHLFWQHYSLPGVYFWKIGESYNIVIFDSFEKTSKPSRTLRKGAFKDHQWSIWKRKILPHKLKNVMPILTILPKAHSVFFILWQNTKFL